MFPRCCGSGRNVAILFFACAASQSLFKTKAAAVTKKACPELVWFAALLLFSEPVLAPVRNGSRQNHDDSTGDLNLDG